MRENHAFGSTLRNISKRNNSHRSLDLNFFSRGAYSAPECGVQPMNRKLTTLVAFKKFLDEHGIDYASWGEGPTKTVERLFYEYLSGETTFLIKKKRLIRIVKRVQIVVYYRSSKGTLYRLIEERQVFKNGAVRKRSRSRSLSEKMIPGERAKDAAMRAMKEEIGVAGLEPALFQKLPSIKRGKAVSSHSYPGLPSIHYGPRFKVLMPHVFYERAGYDEVQQDKKTEFRWYRVGLRK